MSKTHVARLREYKRTTERPSLHRNILDASGHHLRNCSDARSERSIHGAVGFSGFGTVGIIPRKGEKKCDRISRMERRPKLLGVEYLDKKVDGTYVPVVCPATYAPPKHYLVKSFNPSQALEFMSGLAKREAYKRKLHRENPERIRRTAKGLTRRGKRVIRDGIALLERKYGVRGLGFYTLTCPYDTPELIQEFNDKYTEIVRRYFQEIKREYERKNARFRYVAVHEVQPGRLRRTGNECLHLHYIAPAFCGKRRFVLDSARIRHIYQRTLGRVMSVPPDHSPRVGCELVRSSAAAYLAKYYSKGISNDGSGTPGGAVASLSTWYSVDRSLRRSIQSVYTGLPASVTDAIYRASYEGRNLDGFDYIKPVMIEINGVTRHMGAIFQFDKSKTKEFQGIVWAHVCKDI